MLRCPETFSKKLEIAPQNLIASLHTIWKGLTRDIFSAPFKKNLILRHTFMAYRDSIDEGTRLNFGGRRDGI